MDRHEELKARYKELEDKEKSYSVALAREVLRLVDSAGRVNPYAIENLERLVMQFAGEGNIRDVRKGLGMTLECTRCGRLAYRFDDLCPRCLSD